ncbi:hypothetical protein Desdi_2268 [Desulfitobacterium dichloroeliminans LMG P-21439]|uniref:Uncharacterized protein n=1 Tax=Desulfitobacterium dichloroeliminans (strain LMG P-21439 / DCA1) TaxID=871963 RepID=L0F9S7_DESDL|nr:hypothetical protein [Desulfitobacterium dichloroeliminans]AGA69698.1 hypothetical protein Desdi_2268 [Desulfitobacterium dichloroeliminans LMG P-21439]
MGYYGEKFAKWSSIIATIGTSILAITATITVTVTLNAWKIDRESSRPYLSLQDSPKIEAKSGLSLEFKFNNVGTHPVVNLASRTLVIEQELENKPLQNDTYYLANEIPQNMASSLLIKFKSYEVDNSEPDVSPYYIVLHLEYTDPFINQKYQQTLYYRWDGIAGNEVQPIVHVEVREKESILNYLKKQKIKIQT